MGDFITRFMTRYQRQTAETSVGSCAAEYHINPSNSMVNKDTERYSKAMIRQARTSVERETSKDRSDLQGKKLE